MRLQLSVNTVGLLQIDQEAFVYHSGFDLPSIADPYTIIKNRLRN